jgi:hypothetical protein
VFQDVVVVVEGHVGDDDVFVDGPLTKICMTGCNVADPKLVASLND